MKITIDRTKCEGYAKCIQASPKVFKLDAIGNTKVAADVYGGAVKADHDRDVNVTIKGTLQGDTIRVESVKGNK